MPSGRCSGAGRSVSSAARRLAVCLPRPACGVPESWRAAGCLPMILRPVFTDTREQRGAQTGCPALSCPSLPCPALHYSCILHCSDMLRYPYQLLLLCRHSVIESFTTCHPSGLFQWPSACCGSRLPVLPVYLRPASLSASLPVYPRLPVCQSVCLSVGPVSSLRRKRSGADGESLGGAASRLCSRFRRTWNCVRRSGGVPSSGEAGAEMSLRLPPDETFPVRDTSAAAGLSSSGSRSNHPPCGRLK